MPDPNARWPAIHPRRRDDHQHTKGSLQSRPQGLPSHHTEHSHIKPWTIQYFRSRHGLYPPHTARSTCSQRRVRIRSVCIRSVSACMQSVPATTTGLYPSSSASSHVPCGNTIPLVIPHGQYERTVGTRVWSMELTSLHGMVCRVCMPHAHTTPAPATTTGLYPSSPVSVMPLVSPALAAPEGHQSGRSIPSVNGESTEKSVRLPNRKMCGGRLCHGGAAANVPSSGDPLGAVCSSERKGCGLTHGQHERTRVGVTRVWSLEQTSLCTCGMWHVCPSHTSPCPHASHTVGSSPHVPYTASSTQQSVTTPTHSSPTTNATYPNRIRY
jgi:hypothetical protein